MGKRTRDEQPEDELEPTAEVRSELPPPTEELPHDPTSDERPRDPEGEGEGDGRRARVMRFAKRLMDRRELSNDTREILGTVLATSDKAKNEAVRIAAREVRSYLDALELKEDFKELITSYSLEISLSLKPLAHVAAAAEKTAAKDEPEPPDEDL